MTAPPPAEPARCTFVRASGARCKVTFALSPAGLCMAHDPQRRAQVEAARAAGGATAGSLVAKRAEKYRTATPEHLPQRRPPKTLDDVVRWSSWAGWAVTTGLIDHGTCRELNRSLGTLGNALNKRDLLRRIRDLERTLKHHEQQQRAGRGNLAPR